MSITRPRESDAGAISAPVQRWDGDAGARANLRASPFRSWRPAHTLEAILLVGVAAALAVALRALGDQPIVYDADQYLVHGRILISGIVEQWGARTYGYPAFLTPWIVLAGPDLEALRWSVFLAQLVVHVGAAWLFARRVAEALGDAGIGRLTFAFVVLNPFLLIMTGLLLTDLLSTALIATGVGLLLPTRRDRAAIVLRDGMLALFILTLAVEVRPANAILLPVCTLLWMVRWWFVRPNLLAYAAGIVTVGVVAVLPLLPQSFLNWRAHSQLTPLLVNSLYEQQIIWGVQNLKYATFMLRDHPGQAAIFYANPFASGQTSLAELAQAHPLGLVATFALHAFGLFDQDFPFPYVRELDAWHRWPLAGIGYVFLWAACVGLVLGWKRWWHRGTRLAWTVLSLTSAAFVLVYLPTAIECRFGLPLFVLLAPAAAVTVVTVRGWVRSGSWRWVTVAGASVLLTIGVCAWLSAWMQTQSPVLMMTRGIIQTPAQFLPVTRWDADPPARWTIEQRQKYNVQVTNVGDRAWNTRSPGRAFMHIMFVGPGDTDTVDARFVTRLPITQDVKPGDQLEMNVTVEAPRAPGAYRLRQQVELEELPGQAAGPPFETPVTVLSRRDGRR